MHYHLSRRAVDIGGRGDCLHLSRQVGGEAVVQEEKGELVARISFTEHIFFFIKASEGRAPDTENQRFVSLFFID